jgi:hypothetical protein
MPVPLIEMMDLRRRAIYGVSRLAENNEVAGFKFAVVGVFYAVLLAFVLIAAWEEYRGTEAAVRNEDKAVVDLHHVTFAFRKRHRDPRAAGDLCRPCAQIRVAGHGAGQVQRSRWRRP